MSDLQDRFNWTALPPRSSRRINWDRLFQPFVGQFHFGSRNSAAEKECTEERLKILRQCAADALAAVRPEFVAEGERLRFERRLALCVTTGILLLLVFVSCLISVKGYDLIKAILTAGGSGGLLTWGLVFAFKRIDHESALRLFPVLFETEFALAVDCAAYERAFERFARAADALRGAKLRP